MIILQIIHLWKIWTSAVECIAPGLLAASVEVVQPFILGCDTKNPKIVQLSLVAVQRLISQHLLSKVRSCLLNTAGSLVCYPLNTT